MTEETFILTIHGNINNPHEIILKNNGQPICELVSLEDARLIKNMLNIQHSTIKDLKIENMMLKNRKNNAINLINDCLHDLKGSYIAFDREGLTEVFNKLKWYLGE